MIKLYIENQLVDTDVDTTFAITKEFEELSNPTTIINDWSKTVSIPFSENNNKIFGHIYNIDKVIIGNGTSNIGVYFSPLKKLNFRLEWNNATLMTGYAKMNEIKQVNGKGTYEITLWGQLGKLFQEMKKITFDETTNDRTYLINGDVYVDEYLNKDLVYSSWTSSGQTHEQLEPKYIQVEESGTTITVENPEYEVTDIIGFAPNNSYSEGFDYSTYQSGNTGVLFTNKLGSSFKTATGIDADTIIPNGMLPREVGEYRSYMQLPYIYWNKLFQIFQEKAESITGYKFDLDSDWFNTDNPYWYNLVYMLKSFNPKNGNTYKNTYTMQNTPSTETVYNLISESQGYNPPISNNDTWHGGYVPFSIDNEGYPLLEDNMIDIPKDSFIRIGNIPVDLSFTNSISYASNRWKMDTYSPYLMFNISVYTEDDVLIDGSQKIVAVKSYDDDSTPGGWNPFDEFVSIGIANNVSYGSSYTWHISLPYNKVFTYKDAPRIKLKVTYKWFSTIPTGAVLTWWTDEGGSQDWRLDVPSPIVVSYNSVTDIEVEVDKSLIRSNVAFSLNTLWNNDYNIFDEIIKYCKMYRILIYIDEVNKKIIFTPFKKFFEDYTIVDWTNYIDKSKDFVIKPITFENKYVLFNYKDSNLKLSKEYKDKFGVNYGDYRLVTEYNFNENTSNLFKDITQSVNNTDNVLSWVNLNTYHKIMYSFPAETYVYCQDKDKKNVDIFGAFYFHNGLSTFSTEADLRLPSVIISDDTTLQANNNTYFYTQSADTTNSVLTYPNLNVIRGENMCLFNVPKENYTYYNDYIGKNTIYSNLWKKFIDERYNIQNKLITCYVKISPSQYNLFSFSKFVKIDNQLCMVNKIYDYDITNDGTTKVDLVTIQDIDGYRTDDYHYDFLRLSENEITIPYGYWKKVIVKSTGNWDVAGYGDWENYLSVYPTSGTSGITEVLIASVNQTTGGELTFRLLSDNHEPITSKNIVCNVGGTSTITISTEYIEVYTNTWNSVVTIYDDSDGWKLIKSRITAEGVTLNPIKSENVETQIHITAGSNTGVNDYWFENSNGDIVAIRINVISGL